MISKLKEGYTPLYYLAALGNGGLAVSFFMYLMFMLKHPETPMATFGYIWPALIKGDALSAMVALASIGIIYFALQHFRLLIWNIREYRLFKKTKAFVELKKSKSEVTLMAMPLTYAMTINVCFVLGAAFVPHLWDYVEYLFPLAIAGFLAVGIYAIRIFSSYFTRLLTEGTFDFITNNSLSQMLSIFAFAMIAVGFAGPGAMSNTLEINAVAIFFSIFFLTIAVALGAFNLVISFKSILKQGISKEQSVSLWIMLPILTLVGITLIRLTFGFSHHFFNSEANFFLFFILGSAIIALQTLFGGIGYLVMKRVNYFNDFLYGAEKSVESYALICPGVAFFVFGMFFLFYGVVKTGLVAQFGVTYFILLIPMIFVQFKTIAVLIRLNRKLF